jgi:cytochrome c peroxidase
MRIGRTQAFVFIWALVLLCGSCAKKAPQSVEINRAMLPAFGTVPEVVQSAANPVTPEKVSLGRMLYFEKRLSSGGDISCNTCHPLDQYGAEPESVSTGEHGQRGSRNAPTVFNAAGHIAQFWDGRAPDVEEQAKGPVMNPVEMAMPSEKELVAILKAVPEYRDAFGKAFPGEPDPITFDNVGKAIGAFERTLVTPSRWDKFLQGDTAALTDEEKLGFNKFTEVGCSACHAGDYVGGQMFQKLGVVEPWPNTKDPGRFDVSKQEADRMVFKVPSLRNVEKTAPYFHDGSVGTLDEAVKDMGEHQLGRKLKDQEVREIVAWLKALTGTLPAEAVRPPAIPQAAIPTARPAPG